MKKIILALLFILQSAFAGDKVVTSVPAVVFQPLAFGDGRGIHVTQVTCRDWYPDDRASSTSSKIGFISAKNMPPSNNPERSEDINVASLCKINFSITNTGDAKGAPILFLHAEEFSRHNYLIKEEILRSCLECLRKCLPEKLQKSRVHLVSKPEDKEWMEKIVNEFDKHDRKKVFYKSE